MGYSLNKLYNVVGISKQAVHQYAKRQEVFDRKIEGLVVEVDELRKDFPGCGVEKMYDILQPNFIGRDRFVETMMLLGYRLKIKKNYKRTTIAAKVYYPNLIKGMEVAAPSVIWQSDITYILICGKHYYAVFIIDVYTKKIVGYCLSDHMRATANLKALQMALKDHKPPKVHHSDRGGQYIYKAYIKLLEQHDCRISMAQSAQDNAYAERINRTIKRDYLDYWEIKTFDQLKKRMKQAVNHYNHVRTHNNIDKKTPVQFEENFPSINKDQRKTITIFNNEI
ncbi:IS3 family transposase [Aquimarina sp. ERC-38]|uniref:IS3 family transposase n=1 Tax=Aquimarina sp. ERC-38 TaxID=2949996 RepID=UPI002247A566|nr:IS3 family transposase [Aquimarina sp. ERC-38]UZO79915.1 IS3 family transposase [Aquimarina sp. ERC-38]UZO80061.1 IS3 family transposase [Aquimarina sp. ERC-38]UZO81028.1 IS3 family transposase [Aquimarina sp. ERC-38]UZO81878.1 IS3 family transposase [Aquimarina sp. ERC-38]UZO82264.1 IS3 family transposase [Aquimarina sp. ERC-38]